MFEQTADFMIVRHLGCTNPRKCWGKRDCVWAVRYARRYGQAAFNEKAEEIKQLAAHGEDPNWVLVSREQILRYRPGGEIS